MESNNQNGTVGNVSQEKGSGSSVAFIHKKTEKLVTAVYMLSNFFPHEEPIKWKVRSASLALLSNVSNVLYSSTKDSRNISRECVHSIDDIIDLMDLARVSNNISQMNFSILKDEFMSLKHLIESTTAGGSFDSILVASDFFMSGEKFLPKSAEIPLNPIGQIGSSFQQNKIPASTKLPEKPAVYMKEDQKSKQSASEQYKQPKSSSETKEVNQKKSHKKNDRSETIIRLLSKKDNLTIKDIAQVISGCSEKTIQRELLSLVSQNVLKKVGERRWSRYSLARP